MAVKSFEGQRNVLRAFAPSRLRASPNLFHAQARSREEVCVARPTVLCSNLDGQSHLTGNTTRRFGRQGRMASDAIEKGRDESTLDRAAESNAHDARRSIGRRPSG